MFHTLRESKSQIRMRCFDIRKNMILNPYIQFIWTLIVGFFFILPCMVSSAIIYVVFYKEHKPVLANNVSSAVKTL